MKLNFSSIITVFKLLNFINYETAGATALVARIGDDDVLYQPPYVNMPGVGRHEWINNRESAEYYFLQNDLEVLMMMKLRIRTKRRIVIIAFSIIFLDI